MLSLFKRYRLHRTPSHPTSTFGFMTVCQRVKPMSLVEFEFAQQSLDVASDWLYQQQSGMKYADATHYVLEGKSDTHYQQALSQSVAMGIIPVAFVNCHEMVLNTLPVLAQDNMNIGIVHIGHGFELKQTLDLQLGSAFHFALSRFAQAKLFCIGIDTEHVNTQTREYAEDLGCDWVSHEECGFLNRTQLKNQLNSYIEHSEQLVINIDLASLVPGNGLEEHKVLDNQIVLRVLRQMALSGKVRYIQVVGAKDKLIYSKQTKEIVDELMDLAPHLVHAA
ncbi:arginase family protein [Vibrio metoecus]|uniref:arginase family protein n=1 Tax=Vibrio metoecus TaxID=1481663 RepID=UPI00215D114E|nr:arginase family protein [Vibrio metoecus]MCR9386390.1 arginase family protein [Vibrio metoecus]